MKWYSSFFGEDICVERWFIIGFKIISLTRYIHPNGYFKEFIALKICGLARYSIHIISTYRIYYFALQSLTWYEHGYIIGKIRTIQWYPENVETPCRQMGTWEERGYGFARKNVQVSGTCELKLIPRTCWQFRANSLQIKSVKTQLRFFKQNKNGHASFQKVKSKKRKKFEISFSKK